MDYDHSKVPYQLYKPTIEAKLHYDLEEISGLTYYKEGLLAAIEDETGKIYLLDAVTGEVKRKIKFAKSGDYEGIEIIGEHVFVMKSNGLLYDFFITNEDKVKANVTETAFTSRNNLEGLGLHNGKLLIACKGEGEIAGVKATGKGIYSYDLGKATPLLFIHKGYLNSHIAERDYFKTIKQFDPSGIATHPLNGDIYILSADHVLVVYDKELKLKEVVKLDKHIFRQPEGICFSPQGQLYLSSEGDGERGELFVFEILLSN